MGDDLSSDNSSGETPRRKTYKYNKHNNNTEEDYESVHGTLSVAIDSVNWNSKQNQPHDYIELCGVTSDRKSIKIDVMDFKLYFYLKLPDTVEEDDTDSIMSEIKDQLGWQGNSIVDYKYEEKVPARPFQFGRKFKLLKLIFQKSSSFYTILKKLQNLGGDDGSLPGTILINGKKETVIMFETDIKPIERFCQTNLNSSGWMLCTRYVDTITDKNSPIFIKSAVNTDLHIKTKLEYLHLEPNDTKAQSIPLYTTLAIDIETSSLDPESKEAAVYQISQILFDSETLSVKAYLFTWNPHLKKIAYKTPKEQKLLRKMDEKYQDIEIEGVKVYNCNDEEECLIEFIRHFMRIDPSNIAGHNFYGFDLNFILVRAKFYNLAQFEFLGRTGAQNEKPKKNLNQREVTFINLPGRLQIDTMFFLMGYDKGQTSYTLETCCETHLKNIPETAKLSNTALSDPGVASSAKFHSNIVNAFPNLPVMWTRAKGDIEGKDITKHFTSEKYQERLDLAIYCVKDSLLTLRLFVERLIFMKLFKMGQAFRCPIQLVLTSGKQEQVMPNLLTRMYNQNILYNKYHDPSLDPYAELWAWQKYDGGLVRPPKKGKYLKPVAVLDFGGMYPSIMMEYHICMQTIIPLSLLTLEQLAELEKLNHIKETVNGVRIAIINEPGVGFSFAIQEDMKKWRDIAKANKDSAKDEFTKSIYDCEQLAYKIYMNGMYGLFAPVNGGKFTYLLVAAAITQFGRELSIRAGKYLEEKILVGKNPKIVYGDTDSIMYTFDMEQDEKETEMQMMERSFRLNIDIATHVNAHFQSKYITLNLEKIYYPMCLYDNKKYYTGRKWMGFNKVGKFLPPEKEPDIVGIEGKKRDRCEDLRELQYRIIKLLLQTKSNDAEIENEIYKSLIRIAEGKVPLEKFIIVKGLSKDIEGYEGRKLPHVAVARRNLARANLDSCKKGARISYIVYTDEKKYLGGKKALNGGVSKYCEDAMYASNNNLKPDPRYYIEKHYAKALRKLLAPCNIDMDKLYAKPMAIALRTANVGQLSIALVENSSTTPDDNSVQKFAPAKVDPSKNTPSRSFKQISISLGGQMSRNNLAYVEEPTKVKPNGKRKL